MKYLLEMLLLGVWNWLKSLRRRRPPGLLVGFEVVNAELTDRRVSVPHERRQEHLVILGRTGQGKTSLMRHLCSQDITENRGFAFIDLHGDTTPYLVARIAQEERRRRTDLSERLVLIEPADPEWSVGLNALDVTDPRRRHVEIAEVVAGLRKRWNMENFGPRTEELLRSALHVLTDAKLTLLEVAPLITDDAYRAAIVSQVPDSSAKAFFTHRYNRWSEKLQAIAGEAVLNKLSELSDDPHFRHLLGQTQSTLSLADIVEKGNWLVVNLDKGQLGEQAVTIGSLLLTKLRHAVLGRKSRSLFTIYCDELQNLVAYDAGVETLLSESRKFSVALCTANQFLEQHSPAVRASILAVRTQIFFQLASSDARHIARLHHRRDTLSLRLQQLERRHALMWSGGAGAVEVCVPTVITPRLDTTMIRHKSHVWWARRRTDIEREIEQRRHMLLGKESLHGWR